LKLYQQPVVGMLHFSVMVSPKPLLSTFFIVIFSMGIAIPESWDPVLLTVSQSCDFGITKISYK